MNELEKLYQNYLDMTAPSESMSFEEYKKARAYIDEIVYDEEKEKKPIYDTVVEAIDNSTLDKESREALIALYLALIKTV